MSETRKATKILNMGKLVVTEQLLRVEHGEQVGNYGVPVADMETFNPSFGFTKDPSVFQNPMAQFGCANSIEELDEAAKAHYPNLAWELFELMATFPETFRISVMVSANRTVTALLESDNKSTLAWWVCNSGTIYTSSTELTQAVQRRPLNPSEALYAFSIMLAQLSIGAPAASIGRTEDNSGVAVSYVDAEMAMSNPTSARVSYIFPSMEKPTTH